MALISKWNLLPVNFGYSPIFHFIKNYSRLILHPILENILDTGIRMTALIFKTDINSVENFNHIKSILFRIPNIYECTIDLEDVDKVLRIIAEGLTTRDVEKKVNNLGFFCKELED